MKKDRICDVKALTIIGQKCSLQQCDITDNLSKLPGHLALTNNKKRRLAMFGLITVFEEISYNGEFISF